MIQLILMLFGFVSPNNNISNINLISTTVQSNIDLTEDTGGETGTTLPPKK